MSRPRHVSLMGSAKTPYWVRGLLILLLFNGILVSLLLRAGGWGGTSLRYAKKMILFPFGITEIAGTDSWVPMMDAINAFHQDPSAPLYSKVFFQEHIKFQYPPTSLLAIDFAKRATGMSPWRTQSVLNELSWACIPLIGLLTAILLRRRMSVELGEPSVCGLKRDVAALYCIVILLTFSFYPLSRAFYVGQIQTFITLLATASLLAWHGRKKKIAGFLIGLTCLIKPHWSIVLVWGWLRKQWGMALAGTLTAAIVLGVSICYYGFDDHLDYLSVLSALAHHGESYYANQSVNGLVNRLLFNGDNLHFKGGSFPPFNPVVYACTLITSLLLIGSALFWKFRDRSDSGVVELSIVMLSTTMASPIAWEHHYAILLPIFAIILPAAMSRRVFGRWTVLYLVVAFFLASQRLGIVYGLGRTRLNILQSHIFLAAIMVLVLLYILSGRKVAVDTMGP